MNRLCNEDKSCNGIVQILINFLMSSLAFITRIIISRLTVRSPYYLILLIKFKAHTTCSKNLQSIRRLKKQKFKADLRTKLDLESTSYKYLNLKLIKIAYES